MTKLFVAQSGINIQNTDSSSLARSHAVSILSLQKKDNNLL